MEAENFETKRDGRGVSLADNGFVARFYEFFVKYNCDDVMKIKDGLFSCSGADLGGGCRGCAPPPLPEMTCGFLIQVVFCQKNKTMWFIGVEVEQETSAPPPKKNPGSAPVVVLLSW